GQRQLVDEGRGRLEAGRDRAGRGRRWTTRDRAGRGRCRVERVVRWVERIVGWVERVVGWVERVVRWVERGRGRSRVRGIPVGRVSGPVTVGRGPGRAEPHPVVQRGEAG